MKYTYLLGNYECGLENIKNSYNNTDCEVMRVTEEDFYTPEKGYGFITETSRKKYKTLQYSELNSGFNPVYWLQHSQTLVLQECTQGIQWNDNKSLGIINNTSEYYFPILFKATVNARGNYKIKITIHNLNEDTSEFMIFVGRRHLTYKGFIHGKKSYTGEFVVNVSDIIPRTTTKRMMDLTIDVAIVGQNKCLSKIEIEPAVCPTLYVLGDSTVADQGAEYPYAPENSYAGWGQMLSAYLSDKIAISNHAHSGLTIESLRSEGHLAIVYDSIRPGDYCIIQFGHNDQKLMHLKAEDGYRQLMEDLIDELKAKGAKPMLVTPMARNSWKGNDGTYNDLLFCYAQECKRIGKKKQIPVIDLHKRSTGFVIEKGLRDSSSFFYPKDFTHTNDVGAYHMAGYVACEMLEKAEKQIAGMISSTGIGKWEPRPVIKQLEIPTKLGGRINPIEDSEWFQTLERGEDDCKRMECLDFLIQAGRFFPTNVYNDHFKDVMGHEWYAGIIECACQNGIIEDDMVKNGCIRPQELVTMREAIAFARNAYRSRKGKEIDFIESEFISEEEHELLTVSRNRIARLCKDMKL